MQVALNPHCVEGGRECEQSQRLGFDLPFDTGRQQSFGHRHVN
jgi:hypothetical protein